MGLQILLDGQLLPDCDVLRRGTNGRAGPLVPSTLSIFFLSTDRNVGIKQLIVLFSVGFFIMGKIRSCLGFSMQITFVRIGYCFVLEKKTNIREKAAKVCGNLIY